ncbi:MAG: GTP cyclohydrolase I type 2 [Rhodanobacteraceae bacterium]|jgi:GTP cyclohydrolase I|nr:MAG: GTP cyclohydrolase I type 2 [Rhodanobacteraceae bacterium]
MTSATDSLPDRLPDVAGAAEAATGGALDWVGMDGIDLPVRYAGADGEVLTAPACVDVAVDLTDARARGIHMSRLYVLLEQALAAQALTPSALCSLLHALLDSHAGLSSRVRVRVEYRHLLKRPALVSANAGWKSYPVTIEAGLVDGRFTLLLACEVQYSSTCPASLALSRQANQQRFDEDFAGAVPSQHAVREWLGGRGVAATPHAQRSTAHVRVKLAQGFDLPVVDLIDAIEAALATPVQTAVKREDEQAFAVLNAENPMFCEDAARRIRAALDTDPRIAGYHIRAAHHESLHPHDAVAEVAKNFG